MASTHLTSVNPDSGTSASPSNVHLYRIFCRLPNCPSPLRASQYPPQAFPLTSPQILTSGCFSRALPLPRPRRPLSSFLLHLPSSRFQFSSPGTRRDLACATRRRRRRRRLPGGGGGGRGEDRRGEGRIDAVLASLRYVKLPVGRRADIADARCCHSLAESRRVESLLGEITLRGRCRKVARRYQIESSETDLLIARWRQ